MSYDSTDPFDAAAWWFGQLCCDSCGVMLELDLSRRHSPDSDEYWHEYGQRAKDSGWSISSTGTLGMEWCIRCSACAHTLQATPTI